MTEQAADMEIPTDTCTHDIIKMLIYSIISFVSYHFMIGCRAHDHNLAGVVLIS